jgi:hypothetical protein
MVGLGTRGRTEKAKQQGASSSQGSTKWTRVAKEAWMVDSHFKYLCLDDEKKIARKSKMQSGAKERLSLKEEIVQEVKDWVEDPQNTRTRETKYFHLAETYWVVKALVGRPLGNPVKRKTPRSSYPDPGREVQPFLLLPVWHQILSEN